ncbi:50S ribosomal protein L23 [Candidatus Aerophobetes bacterium]|uniref:Large ribosomal subunit protein uL23 n=1 Tax=Aerophobetes bacterium TaxID=2030807 RepID=A0A2A4X8K9_UNCAE|nr:MAG: 50S ribosomal protein L23 [Candidatus Aerophobetes bacterium]
MTASKGKSAFKTIKSRYLTEKTALMDSLKDLDSNPCLRKFDQSKIVFLVDINATKKEIALAVESIYADKKISVTKVNTINVKAKKRRVRRCVGFGPRKKKAIVTLAAGDRIDEAV